MMNAYNTLTCTDVTETWIIPQYLIYCRVTIENAKRFNRKLCITQYLNNSPNYEFKEKEGEGDLAPVLKKTKTKKKTRFTFHL